MSYTYNSENGKRVTISTIEEAKKVIIATATVREHNQIELLTDPDLVKIADHFNIDLMTVQISYSSHPNDFVYKYSFVDSAL